MIIDVFQIYIRLWVRFAVAVFSKMLRSDLSKSRDPVLSGGNGCIFAEANGGPYLYEQADSWFSWDFPWFSMDWKVPQSLSGVWVGDIKKAFCERAENIFIFWVSDEDIWILVGSCGLHSQSRLQKIPARCIKQSLSATETLSIRNLIFLFCSFLPKDENRIRRRHPWDRIKRCRRSFRHNQIHYKIQRVCIVSGHWFEMVDDGSVAVWWYL